MIELQRCTDQETWDDFILENNGHPLQLWGWGQLKMAHGWTADRLLAYDEDTIVAAAQVLTRKLPMPLRAFSYVPRGPVGEQGSSVDFLELIADYAKREHHSVALSIEPDSLELDVPQGWVRAKNSVLPSKTILLDLEKSDSDLLAVMDKKTRQYIRKSTAEAITIKQVRSREDLAKCLDVYHQTSHRAKFSLHNDQYYYDVFNLLGDHSPVFAAYQDDQPIAFLWLAISADTAFELYGGMNEEGQTLRANYALKWYAIRKTKEWGLSRYDFGGLIGDGVSNFKLSWAEGETNLAGTFDRPLSSFYGVWNSGLPTAKKVVRAFKPRR
ncbi:peptidoglycan bridge formation glycyltransferase FemA/FemB family protein [Patescibacteria group bacterium]|nr:MAG: peptidoglycan bridge formation glycyltransferase FemA/FemB family protein [Patescibacteria group bacterium]